MKNKLIVLTILLILSSTQISYAAQDHFNEYVWLAKSSGTWKLGNRHGYYRVLVLRKPGEAHHFDEVKLQFLEELKNGDRKIIKTISMDTPGYQGYVDDISFYRVTEDKMAISIDIQMKAMGGVVLPEVFLISSDGSITKLIKAEYEDM